MFFFRWNLIHFLQNSFLIKNYTIWVKSDSFSFEASLTFNQFTFSCFVFSFLSWLELKTLSPLIVVYLIKHHDHVSSRVLHSFCPYFILWSFELIVAGICSTLELVFPTSICLFRGQLMCLQPTLSQFSVWDKGETDLDLLGITEKVCSNL